MNNQELLALIMREINGDGDEVPPGFKSAFDFANEWKMSLRRAQELLQEAAQRGLVERRDLRVVVGSKRRIRAFYRPAQKD